MTKCGLLTIAEAGTELGLDSLPVSRLVARGSLRAVRLGPQGERRVLVEDLLEYIRGGCRDFTFPPVTSKHELAMGCAWLSNADLPGADTLLDDLRRAAAGVLPCSQAELVAVFADDSHSLRKAVPVALSGRLAEIAAKPAGHGLTRGEAFLAAQIRRAAFEIVDAEGSPYPLGALYGRGPEVYQAVVRQAVERAAGTSHCLLTRQVDLDGAEPREVSYVLSNASLATAARLAELAELAF
jgi:hypothetical protein